MVDNSSSYALPLSLCDLDSSDRDTDMTPHFPYAFDLVLILSEREQWGEQGGKEGVRRKGGKMGEGKGGGEKEEVHERMMCDV